MKQVIIMITCIVIIVAGGIYEIKYLNKSSLYIRAEIEYIKNAINNNNYELAKQQINSTYESWKNVKKIWNIFVSHEEIDSIDEAMIDLKEYLDYENNEECVVATEKILNGLEHTVQRQEVRLDNIL